MLVICLVWGPLQSSMLSANQVSVRHAEGLVHGFLVLRTLNGDRLADGDLTQSALGDRVTTRLMFRFRDGSVYDETTVFSQHGVFRLISDNLVLKGTAFPEQMEISIDAPTGQVTLRQMEKGGKERVTTDRLSLPPDLANGLVLTLLKNIRSDEPVTKLSMVAAMPKPRVVKLSITPVGEDLFSIGRSRRRATRFRVKVELGGMAGLMAPLLGKQPPDTHIWILGGDAPAFVKSEGPLYPGGPIWRIELTSPDSGPPQERASKPQPLAHGLSGTLRLCGQAGHQWDAGCALSNVLLGKRPGRDGDAVPKTMLPRHTRLSIALTSGL